MKIVIDLDNTLTDELGSTVRPGIIELLSKLKKDGHELILFTNSMRQRASLILREHHLREFFSKAVFREDYDPDNRGLKKDLHMVSGDMLLDDDPSEIEHAVKAGKKGFLVTAYRKNTKPDPNEMENLYDQIKKSESFLLKIFRK